MNISGGNNIIAPNVTKIELHFHITANLHCVILTVICNIVFYLIN